MTIVDNLGLKFENGDIKQCKDQKLKLIEPDEEDLELPNITYSSILIYHHSIFKIIRDLGNLSDRLEIKLLEANYS